jgi:integrase
MVRATKGRPAAIQHPDLSHLLADFFDYMRLSRGCSPATIRTYSMAWEGLYRYCLEHHKIVPTSLDVEDLTTELIQARLNHLEATRGNSVNTRNNRLAAIQSFFRFLAEFKPMQFAGQAQMVFAIRAKRAVKKELDYLRCEEAKMLIEATDPETWCGVRDRAMLTLLIQTGTRNAEVRALELADLRLSPPADIRIRSGKGRKARTLPLHEKTIVEVQRWRSVRGEAEGPLFLSTRAGHLSEDALALVVRSNVAKVRENLPDFAKKHITPHTLRHTAAMLMVEAGVGAATGKLQVMPEHPQELEQGVEALHDGSPPSAR